MNLLFPFVDGVSKRLEESFIGGEKWTFQVHLNQVGLFSQKKAVTLHLKSSDDKTQAKWERLYKHIRETLPEVKVSRENFHPHVTIAQCKKSEASAKIEEYTTWLGQGIIVKVDFLALLSRSPESNDQMQVVKQINLDKEKVEKESLMVARTL